MSNNSANSLSHYWWSLPPLPLHLRDTEAWRQRETSILARQRNASKPAALPQPSVTVPNLFIPRAFAGPRRLTSMIREFK
jgi:hypothetical protein